MKGIKITEKCPLLLWRLILALGTASLMTYFGFIYFGEPLGGNWNWLLAAGISAIAAAIVLARVHKVDWREG